MKYKTIDINEKLKLEKEGYNVSGYRYIGQYPNIIEEWEFDMTETPQIEKAINTQEIIDTLKPKEEPRDWRSSDMGIKPGNEEEKNKPIKKYLKNNKRGKKR